MSFVFVGMIALFSVFGGFVVNVCVPVLIPVFVFNSILVTDVVFAFIRARLFTCIFSDEVDATPLIFYTCEIVLPDPDIRFVVFLIVEDRHFVCSAVVLRRIAIFRHILFIISLTIVVSLFNLFVVMLRDMTAPLSQHCFTICLHNAPAIPRLLLHVSVVIRVSLFAFSVMML